MSYFSEMTKGLFWGLGFSVSVMTVAVLYSLYMAPEIQNDYKEALTRIYESKIDDLAKELDAEILSYKAINGKLYISSRVKVSSSTGDHFRLRYGYTKKSDPEYVSTCQQVMYFDSGKDGFTYYETECRSRYYPAEEIDDIWVNVVLATSNK